MRSLIQSIILRLSLPVSGVEKQEWLIILPCFPQMPQGDKSTEP